MAQSNSSRHYSRYPNTFICEDNWPKCYETKCACGKLRPLNPPFSVYQLSQTKFSSNTDCTKRAHSATRNTQPDEIEVFIQNDRIASDKEHSKTERH